MRMVFVRDDAKHKPATGWALHECEFGGQAREFGKDGGLRAGRYINMNAPGTRDRPYNPLVNSELRKVWHHRGQSLSDGMASIHCRAGKRMFRRSKGSLLLHPVRKNGVEILGN